MPLLAVNGIAAVATAQGADDTGGVLELWQANEPLIEKAYLAQAEDWLQVVDFGNQEPGFYWCAEVGNGVTYMGRSEFSVMVEIEE